MLSKYNMTGKSMISPSVCKDVFALDNAMTCKRGGFVIQRRNEMRDLEAELLSTVCSDVQVESLLQEIFGEQLNRGSNKAQGWSFMHVDSTSTNDRHSLMPGTGHPNAESCKSQEPQKYTICMRMRRSTATL